MILPEDEYPSGACENRQEWLLLYSRGVPVPVIAAWCRVIVQRVLHAVDRNITRDPEWWNRCWLIHDHPARPAKTRHGRRSREQAWWEHYADFAAHVCEHGGIPAQNDSQQARVLYRWLENQRRNHVAGPLTHS